MNEQQVLLQMIRSLRLTGAAVHLLADMVDGDAPLLMELIERIEARTGVPVADKYPQGRMRILQGRLPGDTLVDLTPFGSLPYTALEPVAFQANLNRLIEGVRAQELAKAVERGRPLVGASSLRGILAGEQYATAGHVMERALLNAEYVLRLRLDMVQAPPRPPAGRDKAFSPSELIDFLTAMLLRSRDVPLYALMWASFRVTACRWAELRDLDRVDAKLDRPSVTVGGKGGRLREMPVHRPLLQAILALADSRPAAACVGDPLFRTRRGARVHKHVVEDWSHSLHEQCLWAQGHNMRVHALRHTTARLADRADGPAAAGRLLGHSTNHIFGVTGVYLDDRTEDPFIARAATVERMFGPLDAWPQLPENEVLAQLAGLGPGA
ncbi:site-specific integrase [Geodermatophilus sp. SYSU D01176]